MAEQYIRVDVDDMCHKINVRVTSAMRNVRELEDLFQMIESRFIEYWEDVFDSEGATMLGHKWSKLTEQYLEWKIKHGYPPDIGTMKGKLRSSLTGGTGYKSSISRSSASFGQQDGAVPYQMNFIRARNGTTRPLRVNDATRRSWAQLAKEFVASGVEPITHTKPYAKTVVAAGSTFTQPQRFYVQVDSLGRRQVRDPKTGRFAKKGWAGRFASTAGLT